MKITIGIPCYKAQHTICRCLSSIQIQTHKDIEIILATDHPNDNFDFVLSRYPDLNIRILPCEKNTGPGLARQRALNAATGKWITFIDADDVFYTPFAIESLAETANGNVIEVVGMFLQEISGAPDGTRLIPQENPGHPWVFGRLYNIKFLRKNNMCFSELRAMEDGEFNWKINLIIEGTDLVINLIDQPVYVWMEGSDHSITRIGVDENGIPQYNFDLCQLGATEAAIRAINFSRKLNPFNSSIMKFAAEHLVDTYFTYVECKERKPVFLEQNLFVAKKFYNECYKSYEHLIDNDVLKNIYTNELVRKSQDLVDIIPFITFFDFLKQIKEEEYRAEEELAEIRAKLPKEILDNDKKSGVMQ